MKKTVKSLVLGLALLACPVMAAGNEKTVSIANPWEELTAEQLAEESDLSFSVPEGAEDVIYRYLRNEKLAEMQFTLEDDEFCARIQPVAEPTDISGMYYEWENEEEVQIGECTGTLSQKKTDSEEWVELCQWYDEEQGLQYSLSVSAKDIDGLDLTALAEMISSEQTLSDADSEKTTADS